MMSGVELPETRYATVGDLSIAYQVIGEGPIDIALDVWWFNNVDTQWDVAPLARLLRRFASFSRVVVFDKRGLGLSDPVRLSELPSLERWMDDLHAVLEAVGIEQVALVGGNGGGLMPMLFAASYPERVRALVLVDAFPRTVAAEDYPFGSQPSEVEGRLASFRDWGHGSILNGMAPSVADDPGFREIWARYERSAVSPGAVMAMMRLVYELDLRDLLPMIRVPTLVIHRRDNTRIPPVLGHYLADHIPNARFVEIPGIDSFMWAGAQDMIVDEIQEFLTGVRPQAKHDRVLATILFTDIVASTERAAEVGDRRWRALLEAHNGLVRGHIERARGRVIETKGDGFVATFDGPARAIACARDICRDVSRLGIEVRAGLHTGEIELIGEDIGGIAVHIAARIMAAAGPGEVLVSSTVKDLVAGSDLRFDDRGSRELKGVPGEWRLFAAVGG
jgi:class 3 adenylate cyclase/pimeloyl-ACP methyl ester carboxylesterase